MIVFLVVTFLSFGFTGMILDYIILTNLQIFFKEDINTSDETKIAEKLLKNMENSRNVNTKKTKAIKLSKKKRYIDPYTITLMNLYSVYG